MTAPGADSTNGIACVVVLPDRGAMNATTVSSHDAYTAGPRGPPGAHSSSQRQPGVRPGRSPAGSVPASDRRSLVAPRASGPPGQRPHPRVAGQRGHRITRSGPAQRLISRATPRP